MKFFGVNLMFNGFDIFHRGNFNPDSKAETIHSHVIDDVTNLKSELDVRNMPFVVGTQTVSTSAWAGVANTIETLTDGTTVRYWLPKTSTSTAVTLNLTLKDGSTTGAIACYYGGTNRLTTHYSAGSIIILTYVVNHDINGTNYTGWWAQADYDSNNYDRMLWNSTITAGAPIYDYKFLMQGLNGKFYPLTLETGTGTTKTVSTQEFLLCSPILFYNSTTDIALNGTTSNVYSELQIGVLNYTANQATWISQQPIYLKGIVNVNGNFVLDNSSYTSFLTQTLPTTEDGFVYIMLGYMYNTTTIRLDSSHPMYEYRNGKLRPYSGLNDIFDTKAPIESPIFTGTVTATTFSGAFVGNADTSSKLQTARDISLVGDVSGSASFDGLTNVSIVTTVADDSHSHSNYLPLSGGNMTGAISFQDASMYLFNLTGYTNWGMYWNTTDNAFEFHAGGVKKSSIDLDTGVYTGNIVGAVTGNASTASKWATARTLSLTGDVTGSVSIDGNADASITAVVQDDSHNHIISNVDGLQTALDGKANLSTATATLPATAGWYRIATSAVGINRCSARFEIDWALSGVHGQVTLNAGVMYGQDPTLNSIHYSHYGTNGLTKARIVYHTTYTGNYAYLEVYNTGADAIVVTVQMFSSLGWVLVAPNTVGSIPAGYTSQELTFVDGIATEGVFSGSGASLTNLNASALTSGTISGDRGVTAGSTASSFIEYNGTTNTAGQFYGGTTTPTGTTRLNYSGYFYPTYLNLLGSGDTTTTATHYFVEQASDGFVRPKTLANVRTEIVTSSAVTSGLGYTPANINSPTFTGTPTAPTPTTADNSTSIATTAFVKAQGYITSAQAGTIVTTSATQPVGSKAGDVWIQTN